MDGEGPRGTVNVSLNILMSDNVLDSFTFAFIEKNNGMESINESIAPIDASNQKIALYNQKREIYAHSHFFLCNQ